MNVNAIAPGIAAALAATVAGLVVAIPALFGYNYLLSRVKDATSDMQVFIDEFVTKIAEYYGGVRNGQNGSRLQSHESRDIEYSPNEIEKELRKPCKSRAINLTMTSTSRRCWIWRTCSWSSSSS